MFFLASNVKRKMTNATLVTKITLSTSWNRNSGEKQLLNQIIARPVNPRDNAAKIISLEHNSEVPCAVGWLKQMIEIAIKLEAWKNSIELDRTLKTSQDSLHSVFNRFHDSTASTKRMITWQAHWQIANVLHF